MKHRSPITSRRLQSVLQAIKSAGRRGISTLELVLESEVVDVKDVVYELRCHLGADAIVSEMRSAHGVRWCQYWWHEHAPKRLREKAAA